MILLAVFAMLFTAGAVVFFRGVVPEKTPLRESIDYYAVSSIEDLEKVSSKRTDQLNSVLVSLYGNKREKLMADLAIVGRSEKEHVTEIIKGSIGFAFFSFFLFWMIGSAGILTAIISLCVGSPVGFVLVASELEKKARIRRSEFEETLVSLLSLISISMTGGSGLNTAIRHTLDLGGGWVVSAVERAVDEADFRKESPWLALGRLGERFKVTALVELSATLSLVGSSGAQVAETLAIRSDSARSQLLVEQQTEAAKKSGTMGVPLGIMLLSWMMFMAYPAIMRLVES